MACIQLKNISVIANYIEYDYTVSDDLKNYFDNTNKFFIEYSETIEEVPKSILVIPFLCNVLPIIWICDAELIIPEIDKDFYESIPEFKQGYVNMYPRIDFNGKIKADNIVDNSYKTKNKFAAFFSGGVDSFSTLVTHVKEDLTLITLWGSDIKLNDYTGWENVKQHAEETAKQFGLNNLFVKSSFRLFIKEGELDKLVAKKAGDMWWHGFQHGIGLIGHAAPFAYLHKIKTVYIPSTYSSKSLAIRNNEVVTCASFPTIDNNVKLASSSVYHDGWEFTRQDKIHNITEFSTKRNVKIPLRVCWVSSGGSNCCKCEKCYRTIYGILAEGKNPKDFGFNINNISKIEKDIKYKLFITIQNLEFWKEIQKYFIKNKDKINEKEFEWIYKINFDRVNSTPPRNCYYLFIKLRNIYYKILSKIFCD